MERLVAFLPLIDILRDHLMVGCDSLKVVILVRIQVPQQSNTDIVKIYCSDCGKETAHTKCGSATESEEVVDNGQKYHIEWTILLVQCDGCGSTSLYVIDDGGDDLQQLYPYQKSLSSVPEQIRNAYKSAKKIIHISPGGFCVLARRALEAICDERGAKGMDLHKKLDDLSTKNIIPPTLLKMSHQIRSLGNVGAHIGKFEPNLQDATSIDEFFLAVVEYVYIAPEKLKRIEQRVKGENVKG